MSNHKLRPGELTNDELNQLVGHTYERELPRAIATAAYEKAMRAQWIPCEERMPEGERNVLAAWNKECNGGTGMESMTPAAVRALSRSESDDDDDTFVTHWMPLPAAPLAGKGEG